MSELSRNDHAAALGLLARLEGEVVASATGFGPAAIDAAVRFVPSELTTLSVCDMVTGQRHVAAWAGGSLSRDDLASFDRHFFQHPLVRRHGIEGGPNCWRISDSWSNRQFRDSAVYADYYRRVGVDRAISVPLWIDGRTLASVVLNRRGRDSSDGERARLELLRPHLSFFYRVSCRAAPREAGAAPVAPALADPWPKALTPREREVVRWLAHGKTDAEIGSLLGVSRRTVNKHLEHVYVKLGVETRTAAVMRALALRPPDGTPLRIEPEPLALQASVSPTAHERLELHLVTPDGRDASRARRGVDRKPAITLFISVREASRGRRVADRLPSRKAIFAIGAVIAPAARRQEIIGRFRHNRHERANLGMKHDQPLVFRRHRRSRIG